MAETYNGYCVKCKEKRDFEGEVARDERPPDGQGHLPGLRHQDEPDPRQGLIRRVTTRRPWQPVGRPTVPSDQLDRCSRQHTAVDN